MVNSGSQDPKTAEMPIEQRKNATRVRESYETTASLITGIGIKLPPTIAIKHPGKKPKVVPFSTCIPFPNGRKLKPPPPLKPHPAPAPRSYVQGWLGGLVGSVSRLSPPTKRENPQPQKKITTWVTQVDRQIRVVLFVPTKRLPKRAACASRPCIVRLMPSLSTYFGP